MADTTAIPAPAAENTPNLQLDEVTGELVSKSELKKRQKKREADKKKVSGTFTTKRKQECGRKSGVRSALN